jgi:plasmid maintenance system antidote protein VapI
MTTDKGSSIREIGPRCTAGEVLLTEFLWMETSCAAALAHSTGLSLETANAILLDEVIIDHRLAAVLAQTLGTEPDYWLELQVGVQRS